MNSGLKRRLTRPAIYLLLATVVLTRGLSWPIMATGIKSITPIWMGVFRVVGAAVVVIALGAMSGNFKVPPRRGLPMIASLANHDGACDRIGHGNFLESP